MIQDNDTVAKRWKAMGFSCETWVDPPGQVWEDFVHDVDELVYVAEGVVEFEIRGDKKVLKPGDEAFIPAHALHSARNIGGTVAHWYYGYRK